MIHTNMPRNCTVFPLPVPRRLTHSAIYGSQIVDSHNWPTVVVRKVYRICIFITNGSRVQLVRSQVTCSFKKICFLVGNSRGCVYIFVLKLLYLFNDNYNVAKFSCVKTNRKRNLRNSSILMYSCLGENRQSFVCNCLLCLFNVGVVQ